MEPVLEFVGGAAPLKTPASPPIPTVIFGSTTKTYPDTWDADRFLRHANSVGNGWPTVAHFRVNEHGQTEIVVGGFYSVFAGGAEMRPDDYEGMVVLPDHPDYDSHAFESGCCSWPLYPKVFLQVPILPPIDGSEPDSAKLVGDPQLVAEAALQGAERVVALQDAYVRSEYADIKDETVDAVDSWWKSGTRGVDPTGDEEYRRLLEALPVYNETHCEHLFELELAAWDSRHHHRVDKTIAVDFGYSGTTDFTGRHSLVTVETLLITVP